MLNFIIGFVVGEVVGIFCLCLVQGEEEDIDESLQIYARFKKQRGAF